MKAKKMSDLDIAEELGKQILRLAMDEKKDILRKVDEDVQKELLTFKNNIPKDNRENDQ